MIASTTRLQLRSVRYLIPFIIQVVRVKSQIKKSPGCVGIELRKTKGITFWTKTLWENKRSLTAFSQSGAHKKAIPKLKIWCDEAVHAHWEFDSTTMPTWSEAENALVKYGRLSHLQHPSVNHQNGKINTA